MKETLINKINALDGEERNLLLHKVKMQLNEREGNISEQPKRLVAYIKPKESFKMEALHAYLKERLPSYMIPTTIKTVEDFPLLPNGKIDKGALKKIRIKTEDEHVKPSVSTSVTEKKLIAIWEEVLDFAPVLPSDNFFEIGGDSILSIQIVAKARKAGIKLSPNQLFENQTIAELALFAKNEAQEIKKEKVEGELALTPIQYWFFELHKAAPHYWNQIMEVSNTNIAEPSVFKDIVSVIIGHQDALRLSFMKLGDTWSAHVLNQKDINFFYHIDLKNFADQKEQEKEIRKQLITIQNACDISKGSLFKCIFFEGNTPQENRIFLLGHHLVTDLVSWNILQNDIIQLIQQYQRQEPLVLENKTATIKDWAAQLFALSASPEIMDEVLFWQSQHCTQALLPSDFESRDSVFEEKSIQTITRVLNEQDTSYLIQGANDLYHTKTEDLLITALVATMCAWGEMEQFCFLMERHGRTADILSVDVSNTVGWFTAFFPVKMNFKSHADVGEQIKYVKEQLRNIPNNGIGYGVLKYLAGEEKLQQHPDLVFNYLGNQKSTKLAREIMFTPRSEDTRHPSSERNYSMEINAFISDGQLKLNWSFTRIKFKVATIDRLCIEFEEHLKDIIQYCKNKATGEYTPSDFPEANISQEDLDNLLKGM